MKKIVQQRFIGRRAEALRAINCNKGLQPFADADKVQKFNTLCFPFNLEKRHKQRIYQLNPKIFKKNLLFSKNNLDGIKILFNLVLRICQIKKLYVLEK
ncbi:MAG: hypothetical protein WC970_04815 [Dehalococcoidales bacterium]